MLLLEDASRAVREAYETDRAMVVWWAAELECVSAIGRLERTGGLGLEDAESALQHLDRLQSGWAETAPGASVRSQARRLLRVHDLRAADALQLSAAMVAAETQPSRLPFVTLDRRLADAARREGFPIVTLE